MIRTFCSRDIEITTTIQNNAPEPTLKVAVKQGTSLVNGELKVKPGTPLTMEIYLDKESAPIYGLLVSFMRVSDTKSQEETIIFNGYVTNRLKIFEGRVIMNE